MTSTAIVAQFAEALLIGAIDIPRGEVRQKATNWLLSLCSQEQQ